MNLKNLKIVPPEGMEYYVEDNTVKFRPIKKELTYNDVIKKLKFNTNVNTKCTSGKQGEKLFAINNLMNVAKYLNDGWYPDWEEHNNEFKWYINLYHSTIDIRYTTHYNGSFVYFKSEELAQQAIEILGEETIKLALSTDW